MRSKLIVLAALMMSLHWYLMPIARAFAADSEPVPIGIWATQGNQSHIQIVKCGANLCGTIVWLKEPLNRLGKEKIDSHNPDPSLQTRKILGLPLMNGFEQDSSDPTIWTNGKIYNPSNGKTYSCNLTIQDRDTIRVRGYIGFSFLGETQVWTRAAEGGASSGQSTNQN